MHTCPLRTLPASSVQVPNIFIVTFPEAMCDQMSAGNCSVFVVCTIIPCFKMYAVSLDKIVSKLLFCVWCYNTNFVPLIFTVYFSYHHNTIFYVYNYKMWIGYNSLVYLWRCVQIFLEGRRSKATRLSLDVSGFLFCQ